MGRQRDGKKIKDLVVDASIPNNFGDDDLAQFNVLSPTKNVVNAMFAVAVTNRGPCNGRGCARLGRDRGCPRYFYRTIEHFPIPAEDADLTALAKSLGLEEGSGIKKIKLHLSCL